MKTPGIVYGVGISDANYSTHKYTYRDGKRKLIWLCPIYRTWRAMLERAYCPKYHTKEPSYLGTIVCEEWHRFSNFREWMLTQKWEGKEIDKDILSMGTKIYSPKNCVFIPKTLNQFLKDRSNDRGLYLLGVTLVDGKYVSRCSDPFLKKRIYLGYFENELEAHLAWKDYKNKLAHIWANILDSEGYERKVGEVLRGTFIGR